MRALRFLILPVIAIMLAGCNSCHRPAPTKPQDTAKTTSTATTAPAKAEKPLSIPPIVPPKPLKLYYEKDSIPEDFLKEWSAQPKHPQVEQYALQQDASGHWPTDGDLYLVSPRWLASLQQQVKLSVLTNNAALHAVNPAFTSQSFDPNNQVSIPWRWTPYLFYLRHDKELPWDKNRTVFYFRQWIQDKRCLWPADWELLQAMELHYQGKSANTVTADHAEHIAALKQKLAEVSATEKDCWQALLDGKIYFTFLPATYKISGISDEKLKDIEVQMPGMGNNALSAWGTIIYMDQLVIGEQSKSKDLAKSLVDYLLDPTQQARVMALSGYFPVVSKLRHEFDFAPIPLPEKHWFNRSEFLINRPPEPPAPPTPATPITNGTATATSTSMAIPMTNGSATGSAATTSATTHGAATGTSPSNDSSGSNNSHP